MVNVDEKDKENIFVCLLLGSYDHLVITLTYDMDTINNDIITTTLSSHSQMKHNILEKRSLNPRI